MLVGVDEAGRGAVIGPMVIAFVGVPEDYVEELTNAGVRDSKKLSPKRRERIFNELKDLVDRHVEIVSPKEIDERGIVGSMDDLELVKISEGLAKFLGYLSRHYGPEVFRVYIDAPGSFSDSRRTAMARSFILSRIRESLGLEPEIVIEPKADEKYPVVSAASIFAKVIRDRIIEDLKRRVGDFGSGYPSDPKTVAFLERLDEMPEYVRSSRATVQRIARGKRSFLDRFVER